METHLRGRNDSVNFKYLVSFVDLIEEIRAHLVQLYKKIWLIVSLLLTGSFVSYDILPQYGPYFFVVTLFFISLILCGRERFVYWMIIVYFFPPLFASGIELSLVNYTLGMLCFSVAML